MAVYSLLSHTSGGGTIDSATESQVLGVKFTVSESLTFTGFWFYSASGATQLPTEVGLFNSSGTLIFSNSSPSWSGAYASGWIRCAASQSIASGTYTAAVWNGTTAGKKWYSITSGAWGPISNTPLSSASNADYYHDNATSFVNPATQFVNYNIWVDVEVTAGSSETGPFAVTIPPLVASLTGTVTETGSFTITLPAPAVSLTGSVTESGPLAITLPSPKVALAGAVAETGSFAITLPALRVSLAGLVTESGPLAITLPKPAVSITGHISETGPLAITLPSLAVSLTGSVSGNVTSTFAVDLPAPRASLAGVLDHEGPFTPVLPAPKTSLAGDVNQHETGEFAITLPSLAVSLSSAIDEIFSTFNIWLPGGDVIPVLTELSAAIPAPSVSVEGYIGTIGELSVALPLPDVSVTGLDYHSALDIVLPAPEISWTGTDYYSRLEIGLPVPELGWTGTDGHVGEFSILFGRTPMMMLARLLRLDRLRRLFNPKLATLGADTNWTVGSPGTNWSAGTPGTEWNVAYTSAQITSLSTQYVLVPVSATKAGAAYNPTADPVQFAFAPTATYVPQESDWVAGSWQTVSTSLLYPYSAQCLVGPSGATALTNGTYVIYVQITDNPETPVLTAGQLVVT